LLDKVAPVTYAASDPTSSSRSAPTWRSANKMTHERGEHLDDGAFVIFGVPGETL
jgi:hypothetical protein